MTIIFGTNGNDTLLGGFGDDWLIGYAGDDFLDGGYGFDTLDGGSGVDTTSYSFYYGPIVANLAAGTVGFPGNSTLTDKLISIENVIGTPGNDQIIGDGANNAFYGGAGNDTLDGGYGFDTLDGGSGVDTTSYSFYYGPIVADLTAGTVGFPGNSTLTDKLISIENVIGTPGNDQIIGDGANNAFYGGAGNDTLDGGYGFDTLDGGSGVDTTSYSFYYGPIVADLTAGTVGFPGNSTLTDKLISIENVIGTPGNDQIIGNGSRNVFYGEAGNDTLDGRRGNDTLNGGSGNDSLTGGSGSDSLTGGDGADVFFYRSRSERTDVIADFKYWQGDKIQVSGSGFGATSTNQFNFNFSTGALSFNGLQFATLQNISSPSGFIPAYDIVIV